MNANSQHITIDELKKLIADAVENNEIQQSLDGDCKTKQPTKYDESGNRLLEGVAILTTKSKDFEIKAYKWFLVWEGNSESFEWICFYKNFRAKAMNMQVVDYLERPLHGNEMFCELPQIITDINSERVLSDLDIDGVN